MKKDIGDSKFYVTQLANELEIYSENLEITAVDVREKMLLISQDLYSFKSKILRRRSKSKYSKKSDKENREKEEEQSKLEKKGVLSKLNQISINLDKYHQECSTLQSEFHKIQEVCINKIIEYRSKAVCSTCSGRGRQYFMNKKAIVEQEDCNEFVKSCYDSWLMIIKIINAMNSSRKAVMYFREREIKIINMFKAPVIDRLIGWFQTTGLLNNMIKCKKDKKETFCDEETNKNICQTVLNLSRPTFLQDTVKFMKSLGKIKNYLAAIDSTRRKVDFIRTKIATGNILESRVRNSIKQLILHLKVYNTGYLRQLEAEKKLEAQKLALNQTASGAPPAGHTIQGRAQRTLMVMSEVVNLTGVAGFDYKNQSFPSPASPNSARQHQSSGIQNIAKNWQITDQNPSLTMPGANKLTLSDTCVVPHEKLPKGALVFDFSEAKIFP